MREVRGESILKHLFVKRLCTLQVTFIVYNSLTWMTELVV